MIFDGTTQCLDNWAQAAGDSNHERIHWEPITYEFKVMEDESGEEHVTKVAGPPHLTIDGKEYKEGDELPPVAESTFEPRLTEE